MTGTAIVILILGTVFLLGGTIYFIKLAYDSTKKKKTGEGDALEGPALSGRASRLLRLHPGRVLFCRIQNRHLINVRRVLNKGMPCIYGIPIR